MEKGMHQLKDTKENIICNREKKVNQREIDRQLLSSPGYNSLIKSGGTYILGNWIHPDIKCLDSGDHSS